MGKPRLQQRISESLRVLRGWEQDYGREGLVVMCSFGKDSMVLLHLTRALLGWRLPVLTYREPWWPRRWKFATRMAESWNLQVYSPPPARTWAYRKDEHFVLGASYDLGAGHVIDIPKDVERWEPGHPRPNDQAVCGWQVLQQPIGAFLPPWKAALNGHKDDDLDPVLGKVPLLTDRLRHPEGTMDLLYPLRTWTDEDIWDYAEAFNVPVDTRRYDTEARRSHPHKRWNTDWTPACVRCLECGSTESVPCPIARGAAIPGKAEHVPWMESLQRDYFTAENEG